MEVSQFRDRSVLLYSKTRTTPQGCRVVTRDRLEWKGGYTRHITLDTPEREKRPLGQAQKRRHST